MIAGAVEFNLNTECGRPVATAFDHETCEERTARGDLVAYFRSRPRLVTRMLRAHAVISKWRGIVNPHNHGDDPLDSEAVDAALPYFLTVRLPRMQSGHTDPGPSN